jgi:quercetin dioxygenase-like cupin family protein
MDVTEFERSLVADGYVGVPKEMPSDTVVTDHSHPWDVRALVTSGKITLTIDTVATTYQAGDIFTMAADCIHHEQVGPNGVEYLAGRRDPNRLT